MKALGKIVSISVPAALAALVLIAGSVEAWTRTHWNERKGTPGFFLSDPVRMQRLAPGYRGWFAGVPVAINQLELRADREYDLAKSPRTFRILVLGDSVTFGHGSVYESSYPALLQRRLEAWRPGVDWQVWNAAVPGYNTSQELAQLLEVGPRFQPDLIVVGFFENDVVANFPVVPASAAARLRSGALSWAYRHVYSIELYKRLYLQAAWALSRKTSYRLRLAHVAEEESLISAVAQVRDLPAQHVSRYDVLRDEDVAAIACSGGSRLPSDILDAMQREPGWPDWVAAVRRFQALHRSGAYSIAFFVNVIPRTCPDADVFFDGGSAALNDFFMRVLGEGTPAVSVYDAFRRVRPSQMPGASGHALANANAVKADVLFRFLRDRVFDRAGVDRVAASRGARRSP
jgi:GDSL-like lipase/acylhydrolase family protein